MTRQEYINGFIKKWGPGLPLKYHGKDYTVSVTYLAAHGIKQTLLDCAAGKQEALSRAKSREIPEDEAVKLISVVQGAPAADVGIYKLPDDTLGLSRISCGGDTHKAVYVQYRGNIKRAIHVMEVCLELLKKQAEKGEAPPPPDYDDN